MVKPTEAETAYNLALHLRGILSEITPHGRVLHIAHSGGAILTYLAAKHHLNSNETSRIDVITLGPGRSITRKYFKGGRLVNYYAKNDPVVLLDRRAGWLIKLDFRPPHEEHQLLHSQRCETQHVLHISRCNIEPSHTRSLYEWPHIQNSLRDGSRRVQTTVSE